MRLNLIALLFLFPVIWLSCTKDKHTTSDGQWLFPIAKGTLSLTSLKELKDKTYNVDIPAISIGQPVGIVVASPGLNISHVGPFPVEISPWLHRIDVDSLEIAVNLQNFFPIPIGAGTKISIRNTRDTSGNANVVTRVAITKDVPPGGFFGFDVQANNTSFGDSVYFVLDSFVSPPYANVTFSSTPSKLTATLKIIAASQIQIYSNKAFSSIDTSEFSAGDQDNLGSGTNGAISDTSVSGFINVFLDNALPANTSVQAYFLNDTKTQVIDSLFPSELSIAGINTDATGSPLSVNSSATRINVTRKRIENIKKAKYTVTKANLNTIGYTIPWVTANKNAKLTMQLTGDLNIKIKF